MTEDTTKQTAEDAQRFKDAASKLFQVPINEVRELEEKEERAKNLQCD